MTPEQEIIIIKERFEALEKLVLNLTLMHLRPNEHIPQADRTALDHLLGNLQYAGVKNYEEFNYKGER